MSSVHRILTGLEFALDPASGQFHWPAETEDLVRLSMELARVTRSRLAFAAVADPPDHPADCGQVDAWCASAEQEIENFIQAAIAVESSIEYAAWFGNARQEWAASARESEMDLLIVPGTGAHGRLEASMADNVLPNQAGCPVWFAGREPDRLATDPPLIVFCDDLSDEAAVHLPFAVDLALGWNARLLIVHPRAEPLKEKTSDCEDRLRREIFVRLSRTDFRAIAQGSQLRLVAGGWDEVLAEASSEQIPNLVMSSAPHSGNIRPPWRGHLLLWTTSPESRSS